MKKRGIGTLAVFSVCMIGSLVIYGTATQNVEVPSLLQAADVKITAVDTQNIIYESTDGAQSVTRIQMTYHTEQGEEFRFDKNGGLTLYLAADREAEPRMAMSLNDITMEYLEAVLKDLIPDIGDFSMTAEIAETSGGFQILMGKNVGTVKEDILILNLDLDGTVESFNLNRSNIESETEVDCIYFEQELNHLIEQREDTAVEKNILYKKINHVICAFCSVVYVDEVGGRYVESYTILEE